MSTIQFLTILLLVFIIIILRSFDPARLKLSDFETRRLMGIGDKKIKEAVDRENVLDLLNLIFELIFLILFIIILFIIFTSGELINGIFIILFSTLAIFFMPKLRLFKNMSNRLFGLFEKQTLIFFSQRSLLLKLAVKSCKNDTDINSIEEFRHIVESLPDYIVDSDSRKIISSGLIFNKTTIKEIMTPSEEVKCVEKSEFLGPLVLDELHKLKHSKLPVISQNFNHIVGILYLDKLLSLDIKRSVTAEKIMDPKVEYVGQEDILLVALTRMIRLGLNIIIVKDGDKNVGIVTIRDIVEFLIGQELTAN